MTMRCRVLPHLISDGPTCMAIDEALLDLVAEQGDSAYLRTYGWEAPTLSLGYFQSVAEAEADPRWRRVPWVRRATGGGAIWHHHELTYALVVPAGHPLARPSTALYRAVHAAIAAILNEQGLPVSRRGDAETPRDPETAPKRPFLCFTDRDPEDIVSGGVKVVGSAQRRRKGSILQHGSLLLARSEVTPELPGAGDLADVPGDPRFWSDRLLEQLPGALGLQSVAGELPDRAAQRTSELRETLYRRPAWTRRR